MASFADQVNLKAVICIFLLFATVQEGSGQILIGPIAGAQYSWVQSRGSESSDLYRVRPVYGFNAGVGVSFAVRKRFHLHTGLLYSTKGKVVEGIEDRHLRNEVTYHYIDLPVVYTIDFQGTWGSNKAYRYSFGIGPNVSYWLGGRGSLSSTDLNELTIERQSYRVAFGKDINDIQQDEMGVADPNRVQLGLNFAAGLLFEPVPYRWVSVTVRYEFGHSFFSKTSDGVFLQTYYADPMNTRNHGVRLSVAYLVDLKVAERKKGRSTVR